MYIFYKLESIIYRLIRDDDFIIVKTYTQNTNIYMYMYTHVRGHIIILLIAGNAHVVNCTYIGTRTRPNFLRFIRLKLLHLTKYYIAIKMINVKIMIVYRSILEHNDTLFPILLHIVYR